MRRLILPKFLNELIVYIKNNPDKVDIREGSFSLDATITYDTISIFMCLHYSNKDYKSITKPEVLTISNIIEYQPTEDEKMIDIIANVAEKIHSHAKVEKTNVQKTLFFFFFPIFVNSPGKKYAWYRYPRDSKIHGK